jgi:hypothetical protein
MGTRNLTMVIHQGKPVIAQYGQWDGYPSGQGSTVLEFLKKRNLDKFKEKLKNVRFCNEKDEKKIQAFLNSIGCKDGWMNGDQSEKYHEAYPYLSRDHGAKILDMVYEAEGEVMLHDQSNFAGDSLFCEWAYVIDLDKNVLECYKGFNKRALGKTQRFKNTETEKDSEYTPIRCVKKYKLNELPTEKRFIKELTPKDED